MISVSYCALLCRRATPLVGEVTRVRACCTMDRLSRRERVSVAELIQTEHLDLIFCFFQGFDK